MQRKTQIPGAKKKESDFQAFEGETGGVMIFMTDGNHGCDENDDSDLTDGEVLRKVEDSKAKVVTVAFG